MIRRLNPLLIMGIVVACINGALLFVVIPRITDRVALLYGQDRFIDGYDQIATNLVRGNGYRFYPDTAKTMMREPGYPIFLAGLMLAFGSAFTEVKLANMVLALATAWLTMCLAGRISKNRVVLIVSPLLFLFHPATLVAESRGGVETLFTFLVVLFMLTLYRALEDCAWWRYLVSGAVLGVTVLVKSTPMLFPFILLLYLLLFERYRSTAFTICKNITIMMVAMVVVLSPWIIRNYTLTRQFVPTASVFGISAHAGQYICTHFFESKPWWLLDREAAQERSKLARGQGYHFEDGYYQAFYSTDDELTFSRYLARRVLAEYESAPLLCARCVSFNLFNFWFAGKSRVSTAMNVVVQLPYLILALVGTVWCVRNRCFKLIGPCVLFSLYMVAVYVPILAQARYSVPLIPFLSILASIAVVSARKKSVDFVKAFPMRVVAGHASSPAISNVMRCRMEKE
jgi:4-amino-4-deoxy-L-arabinose transferase-like glycosyltransferase